ncbi:hypothetical protein, conserved [Leishmania tarentolae]|uniref:Uncharacterized protein n=1 Tax=Leishmania tarentolae TaxID=5689 RepID=A0A640K7J1_LEITA|nr:hypothetical protein, conserved [Leishmania tarentolae]
MSTIKDEAFAGYAYYSTGGEGFIYTLISEGSTESSGTPVVLVNDASKAVNFFPFLLLVAGGTLMVALMAFLTATFCCRREVAKLEKTYWALQYAFADMNHTLVQSEMRRASSAASMSQVSLKQKHSRQSTNGFVAGPQSPSQMISRCSSVATVTSTHPSQYMMDPMPAGTLVLPATTPPYGMNVNPLYRQPVNASATNPCNCSYGNNCAQATLFSAHTPPLSSPQPQTQTQLSAGPVASQSLCSTPEPPLRRRASKVSFIGA